MIKLNLFYDNNRKIEAYATKNKEAAFEKAKKLAQLLNVAILDATKPETEWL